MKKFFNTELRDMTIGQSFLYLLLYMIFIVVVTIVMMIVPQHAEEIWDTIATYFEEIKEKLFKKKEGKPIVVKYEKH